MSCRVQNERYCIGRKLQEVKTGGTFDPPAQGLLIRCFTYVMLGPGEGNVAMECTVISIKPAGSQCDHRKF